jgi:hypothetical protein
MKISSRTLWSTVVRVRISAEASLRPAAKSAKRNAVDTEGYALLTSSVDIEYSEFREVSGLSNDILSLSWCLVLAGSGRLGAGSMVQCNVFGR